MAARFYAARGFETIAHAYLRNARHCYLRWGADGKVRQLEQLHPAPPRGRRPAACHRHVGAPVEQLDVGAVVKASQAVSGEIVLDQLIETLMTIALEHAGAERGLLILLRGDKPRIEAEATTGREDGRGHAPTGSGDTGRAARIPAPHRDPDAGERDPG